MSDADVPPFISFLREAPDDGHVIFPDDYEDDRTNRMLNCLVRSCKTLRDVPFLKDRLIDLKLLSTTRALVQTVLIQHLQTPLSDNSVLEEFMSETPGSEICRFHLLVVTRGLCENIYSAEEAPGDLKKTETDTYVEGMIRKHDCMLLASEIHKYKFMFEHSMYLFECVKSAINFGTHNRIDSTTPVDKVQYEIIKEARANILVHLIGAGVYVAMLTVCFRNDRCVSLIAKFIQIMVRVNVKRLAWQIVYDQPNHPMNNALASIFQVPGNLVKLQTLLYNVFSARRVSTQAGTIGFCYGKMTQMINLCVKRDELSFSESEEFEASKWMIRNMEKLDNIMSNGAEHAFFVQEAIFLYTSMDTIDKLFQAGYMQRLVDNGVLGGLDNFVSLQTRWNAIPNNPHQWQILPDVPLGFAGMSP